MKDIQERVKQLVEKYNLQKDPEVSALDLVSEVGEVAKEILLASDYGKRDHLQRKEIEEEIGDVFFSLLIFANNYNIDLEKVLEKVLDKCERRFQEKGHIGSR